MPLPNNDCVLESRSNIIEVDFKKYFFYEMTNQLHAGSVCYSSNCGI